MGSHVVIEASVWFEQSSWRLEHAHVTTRLRRGALRHRPWSRSPGGGVWTRVVGDEPFSPRCASVVRSRPSDGACARSFGAPASMDPRAAAAFAAHARMAGRPRRSPSRVAQPQWWTS